MLVAKASQYAEANCGATQGGLLKGMASSRSRSFCWIQAIQETSMVMPKDAGPFPVKMVNTEMYLATFRWAGVVDMCKRDSMVFEAFCKGSRNWELQRNSPTIWLTKLLEIVTYHILVLFFGLCHVSLSIDETDLQLDVDAEMQKKRYWLIFGS